MKYSSGIKKLVAIKLKRRSKSPSIYLPQIKKTSFVKSRFEFEFVNVIYIDEPNDEIKLPSQKFSQVERRT